MDNCKVLTIDKNFNRKLLSILESSPIHAKGLSLYFDKSPDIFEITRMNYSDSWHVGFFIDGTLKGFASLGYYDARVHGRPENVFTFYNFFLLPEARGRKLPQLAIKDFFSSVVGKANFGISVTMKGNRSTESYIGRRIEAWMPPTRVIDELVVKSILFSFPQKNVTNYTIRTARLEDIPVMVKLLKAEHAQRDFGLIFREETFQSILTNRGLGIADYYLATDKRGEIKGVCLAWDCSNFRRTRVLSFAPAFYPALLAYKSLEKLLPMAPFPKMGEEFKELTITDYAVENRDPVIMHALLSEIYFRHHNRKYHLMNWASCRTDPLLKAAKGFWNKNIVSHILFTSLDPDCYNIKTTLPYVDIAFL